MTRFFEKQSSRQQIGYKHIPQYQCMYIHSLTTTYAVFWVVYLCIWWRHFCKYRRHRHPLHLCTINSSVYRHEEITWMGTCICWRITTKWNAFRTNSRQILLGKRLYFIYLGLIVCYSRKFESFNRINFPSSCIPRHVRHSYFKKHIFKRTHYYISLKLAQLCLNHFVFTRVIAYHLVLLNILGNTLIVCVFLSRLSVRDRVWNSV